MLLFGPGTDRGDWLTVHVMENMRVNDVSMVHLWWLGPRFWHEGYVLDLNWPKPPWQACDVDGNAIGEVRDRFYLAVEDAVLWVEERER